MSREQEADRRSQADEAEAASTEASSETGIGAEDAALAATPASGTNPDPTSQDGPASAPGADESDNGGSGKGESGSGEPDSVDSDADEDAPAPATEGGSDGVQVRGETGAEEVAAAKDEEAEEEPVHEMTFTEHLNELRVRLMRCLIGAFVGFLACYGFAEQLFMLLMQPLITLLEPSGGSLIYTGLPEAFFTHLKVAALAGLFVASPYIFYQIWMFIAPGLYEGERKYMIPIALCSAICFVTGALFGYFVVFPFGFQFFLGYASEVIRPMPSVREYFSFSTSMLFAFGLIFELPLFMFFLSVLGVVNYKSLRKFRKFAILGSFVVAAILTPPDVVSQCLMAGPMCLLYEVGIWVSYVFGKKPKEPVEEEASQAKA
ncbi:MAG: twin-arginine translocase subunit TatC [Desulfomicrobium sp.]